MFPVYSCSLQEERHVLSLLWQVEAVGSLLSQVGPKTVLRHLWHSVILTVSSHAIHRLTGLNQRATRLLQAHLQLHNTNVGLLFVWLFFKIYFVFFMFKCKINKIIKKHNKMNLLLYFRMRYSITWYISLWVKGAFAIMVLMILYSQERSSIFISVWTGKKRM